MIDSVFIDMDGTLIDFAKGDLRRALMSMSNPSYYRGLPLIDDCASLIKTIRDKGIKIRIISGIADPIASKNYIPDKNYEDYFQKVADIKLSELHRHFGKKGLFTRLKRHQNDYLENLPFDSVDFIAQSDSKADFVRSVYGTLVQRNSILYDDYDRYCDEWNSYSGTAYQIGKDYKSLYDGLEDLINRLEKEK